MNQKFSNFFIETFHRLGLESPRYFRYWQYIGLVAAFFGFLPQIFEFLDIQIAPNTPFSHWLQIFLKVAGLVTYLNNKLPVMNANKVVDQTNKLPVSEIGKVLQADANLVKTPEEQLQSDSDKIVEVLDNKK